MGWSVMGGSTVHNYTGVLVVSNSFNSPLHCNNQQFKVCRGVSVFHIFKTTCQQSRVCISPANTLIFAEIAK